MVKLYHSFRAFLLLELIECAAVRVSKARGCIYKYMRECASQLHLRRLYQLSVSMRMTRVCRRALLTSSHADDVTDAPTRDRA